MSRTCPSAQTETPTRDTVTPHSCPLLPATTISAFPALNSTAAGISWQWRHTVSVCLWAAFFAEHNSLEVLPCCSRCQSFRPFHGWVAPHSVYLLHFVHPFILRWLSALFPLTGMVNPLLCACVRFCGLCTHTWPSSRYFWDCPSDSFRLSSLSL